MLLYMLHQKSEEDAKNMHPYAYICILQIYIYIYILILCSWDQNKTTIWILESAVPSCLGNVNPSVLTTDISYCENRFSAPRFAVQVMWACSASQTNKSPHCPPPPPPPQIKSVPKIKAHPTLMALWYENQTERKKTKLWDLIFLRNCLFWNAQVVRHFYAIMGQNPPTHHTPHPQSDFRPILEDAVFIWNVRKLLVCFLFF